MSVTFVFEQGRRKMMFLVFLGYTRSGSTFSVNCWLSTYNFVPNESHQTELRKLCALLANLLMYLWCLILAYEKIVKKNMSVKNTAFCVFGLKTVLSEKKIRELSCIFLVGTHIHKIKIKQPNFQFCDYYNWRAGKVWWKNVLPLAEELVKDCLGKINVHRSMSPNGFHPQVLIELAEVIAELFFVIFAITD